MAKNELKLSDFQRNKENPFMKQAIEDIENHVVKKYKRSTDGLNTISGSSRQRLILHSQRVRNASY
jgi:hypothetical protein